VNPRQGSNSPVVPGCNQYCTPLWKNFAHRAFRDKPYPKVRLHWTVAASGPWATPDLAQSNPDRIKLTVRIKDRNPEEIFQDWTDPQRLRLWWPPDAQIEAREGGTYQFSWPKMGWILRGKFNRFVPGRELQFSWCWDHEPADSKQVGVVLRQVANGTEVTVVQGLYTDSPRDRELRREHIEGWTHFLRKLGQLAV
jgi:uncharacterized protein YndB with AHSA1/START domain